MPPMAIPMIGAIKRSLDKVTAIADRIATDVTRKTDSETILVVFRTAMRKCRFLVSSIRWKPFS